MAAAHNGRWQEVLDAALRLFREQGYHATSMQDIADAVGLQKGSLYHYIRTKEELLFPLVHQTIAGYVERLQAIASRPGSALGRLEEAVRSHITSVARHGDNFSVFLSETRALEREQRRQVHEVSRKYRQLLEGLIREGIAAGELRPLDAEAAALALVGACNWIPRWYSPQGRLTPEQIADVFADIFLNGLRAGTAPARNGEEGYGHARGRLHPAGTRSRDPAPAVPHRP